MRRAWWLLPLAACAADPPAAVAPVSVERAREVGSLVRAAHLCRHPLSAAAEDRAARLEAEAIEAVRQQGGTAARDAFLQQMAPPALPPREQARWCGARQAEVARLDAALGAP